MIVDEYIHGNGDLLKYVEDYITAQATLQTISNPSGTFLPDGIGLGEPKYLVDGTRFNLPVCANCFLSFPRHDFTSRCRYPEASGAKIGPEIGSQGTNYYPGSLTRSPRKPYPFHF